MNTSTILCLKTLSETPSKTQDSTGTVRFSCVATHVPASGVRVHVGDFLLEPLGLAIFSFSSLLLSSLEWSDTKVYEPEIRTHLGEAICWRSRESSSKTHDAFQTLLFCKNIHVIQNPKRRVHVSDIASILGIAIWWRVVTCVSRAALCSSTPWILRFQAHLINFIHVHTGCTWVISCLSILGIAIWWR